MARQCRNIRTLAEVEAAIHREAEERKAYLRKQLAEVDALAAQKLEQAVAVRQAAALVEGHGIPCRFPSWDDGTACHIDLGLVLTKQDRKRLVSDLAKLRAVLGRRKDGGRSLDNAKRRLVQVEYAYPDFPGITVSWKERLPKNAKCRIERRRSYYSTLVCEC